MASPDDHQDPDEHAATPLLPPEDRLWRHPSELSAHPLDSASTLAPPPNAGREPSGSPSRSILTVAGLAGLAGVLVVAGTLWAAWPRQVPDNTTGVVEPTASGAVEAPRSRSVSATGTSVGTFDLPPPAEAPPEGRPARLGVEVVDVSPPLAGLVGSWGAARVVEVERGSAAERAGLLPGDLITGIGETRISSAADLVEAVRAHDPGDATTLRVGRGGANHLVEVELG